MAKYGIRFHTYEKVLNPDDLQELFRPIVEGPNSPTQRLSYLLDIIL